MSACGRVPCGGSSDRVLPQAWQKFGALSFGWWQAGHRQAGFYGRSIYRDKHKYVTYEEQTKRKTQRSQGKGLATKSGEVRKGKSNTAGSPFRPRRKESTAIAHQYRCGCRRGTTTVKAKRWRWLKEYRSNGPTRTKAGKTDVMFDRYWLNENINARSIRGRPRQQASIPSSARVAVQRHQVNFVWPKLRLNSGPRLVGQRIINVS